MPCATGTREQVEAGKRRWAAELERRRNPPPEDLLWQSLVHRVYREGLGVAGLSAAEQCYWDANVLNAEVYNGGFDQFFHNSSGDRFAETVQALRRLGAARALHLLEQAAMEMFGDLDVPSDQAHRWQRMQSRRADATQALDALDREFWQDADALWSRIQAFGVAEHLLPPPGEA